MMGGDVMVTSEPGKGSVFTVRLPASAGCGQRAQSVRMVAGRPAPIAFSSSTTMLQRANSFRIISRQQDFPS